MGKTLILGDSWGDFVDNPRPKGLGTNQFCESQTVYNNAVGGQTASVLGGDFASQTEGVVPAEITRIWLTIGGNDFLNACQTITMSEIKTRVQNVVDQVVTTFPNAQIAMTGYTTPPCASDCWTPTRSSDLANVYSQLSNITYFNIQGWVGGSGAGSPSDSKYYQDCIHLNDAGYIKIFNGTTLGNFLCESGGFSTTLTPASSSNDNDGDNDSAMVPIIIGVGIGVILVIAAAVYLLKKKK